MTNRFDGRVVMVTGASSGIGRTAAVAFGREGAKLVLSGRRREHLEQTLALVGAAGGDGVVVSGDCSKVADVRRMVETAVSTYGRLDCAFNNAGIEGGKAFVPTADYAEEIWDEVIAVNLTSTFMLSRAATRHMLRSKTGYGRIINISSVSGILGNPGQGNYAASKAGMVGMTKSLAREVAPRGITANCIAPGFIKTAMTEALNEKQTEEISKHIPAQRFGTPEDIAAAALYLASVEAGYMTGQTLHVNGGMAMI